MPGEIGYRVIGAGRKPLGSAAEPAGPADPQADRPAEADLVHASCGAASRAPASRRQPAEAGHAETDAEADPDRTTEGQQVTVTPDDVTAVSAQLGRPARGIRSIAHRCTCGLPDVVETEPRLPDGTPFPTTYYLTCPRLASAIGRLEAAGRDEGDDRPARRRPRPGRAATGRARGLPGPPRAMLGDVPEIDGISAGGMPTRVKCLHVLVGHSLAAGPGVNPLGDEALEMLARLVAAGPLCRAGRVRMRPSGVAAIDCGTNSIRLLIADVDADGVLDRRRPADGDRPARPGRRPDRARSLRGARADRVAACAEYADADPRARRRAGPVGRDLGGPGRRATGTTSSPGCRPRSGVEPDIISGAEEAAPELPRRDGGSPADVPGAVSGDRHRRRLHRVGARRRVRRHRAESLDMGSVRMTERHLHSDPPTVEEIAAATKDVGRAARLRPSCRCREARCLIGVAGTVTTVAAVALGLTEYDPARSTTPRIPAPSAARSPPPG